jgi:hypothetical protein
MSKLLFEITVCAFKTFYVEADNKEAALESEAVADEEMTHFSSRFSWEHDDTRVKQLNAEESANIREKRARLICE